MIIESVVMKKILVVDESALFRTYLDKKLKDYEFEVVMGANGLDAIVKMRSEVPDLIIMDFFLSRRSSVEVLQEKTGNVFFISASGKIIFLWSM